MASVLCFASAKGGSGKTVISASLALFLGELGKRVLLIDTDAATNGMTLFYLTKVVEAKRGSSKNPYAKAGGIFDTGGGFLTVGVARNVDLIPASFVMGQTEDTSIEDFRTRLAAAINSYAETYDYIICDAQAGADRFAFIAVERADVVVVVSEYDPVSAEGVDRLRRVFGNLLEFGKTWILFNKVLPEFATELGDFLGVARYLSPVPWDADVLRAFTRRQLAIDLERGNSYTLAIVGVARSLFIELEGDIDQWRQSRQTMLRRPLDKQIDLLVAELEAIEETQADLTSMLRRDRVSFTLAAAAAGSVIAIGGTATLIALSRSSGQIQTFFVTTALLGALLALSMLLLPFISTWTLKRSEERRIQSEAELRELEKRAAEVKAELGKYQTLANADFDLLVKSRAAKSPTNPQEPG